MREFDEISKDAVMLNEAPGNYNMIEIHCFLCMKQLLNMFNQGYINKDTASKNKLKIKKSYEEEVKSYEFKISMFDEHINSIKETESKRIELRKLLNSKSEVTDIARVCLDIINDVFPGEFN